MPVFHQRIDGRESTDSPPSPGTYIWPLLLIVVLCAGFVWYRRVKQSDVNFELSDILKYRPTGLNRDDGVRLSVDDMPSRHEFLVNNASTDSLPAEVELPTVSRTAIQQKAHPSDIGTSMSYDQSTYMDDPAAAQGKAARVLGWAKGRRSARRGPVEGNEGDSSEEEESIENPGRGRVVSEGEVGRSEREQGVFGIGKDEDGPMT